MSDQTTNTNKKTDKEKTVKKRAARSIVAPRIEEETGSRPSPKRETAYIPGTPRPLKPEKSAATIVSPVPVNSDLSKKKVARVLSAPAGVIMNEDKLPPMETKKPKQAVTATGWPERPPQPKNAAKQNNTGSGLNRLAGTQKPVAPAVSNPVNPAMPKQADITARPGQQTGVLNNPGVTPATPDRTQTIEVMNDPDGIPRKVIKTVVTTTTTTYEPLTDEEINRLKAQQTGSVTVAAQPVRQAPTQNAVKPGVIPEPVINRAAVAGGKQPSQATPTARHVQQPTQNVQPQPVQPQSVQPVQTVQPAQQAQTTQPLQPQPGAQPVQSSGSIIGTMQATQPQAPMTAMDRQLAEIEKALGLSGDSQPGSIAGTPMTNAPTAMNTQVPGMPAGQTPAGMAAPPPNQMDDQTKKTMEYFMLGVEALIFVIVLCVCISIYQKIKNKGYTQDNDNRTTYESDTGSQSSDVDTGDGTESFDVEQAGEGDELVAGNDILAGDDILAEAPASEASDSVDVDNDKFTLQCTNITVTLDMSGNPTALIYFSFTNKISEQLSLSEVFPISVTQNGEPCDMSSSLEEFPEEFYNKDMKISDGSTLNCCYAVTLKDAVSPIRLTVHDNHETFSDVGSTEIAIQ